MGKEAGEATGRLALRWGEVRFEAEGPTAWVEAMAARWAGRLPSGALMSEGAPEALDPAPEGRPQAEAPGQAGPVAAPEPEATEASEGEEAWAGFRRVPADFRPRVNLSLADFVALKRASSPLDLVLAAAYYRERYLGEEEHLPSELHQLLAELPAWACGEAQEWLELASVQGWMEQLEGGRWTLSHRGQDHVRHDMAHQHEENPTGF